MEYSDIQVASTAGPWLGTGNIKDPPDFQGHTSLPRLNLLLSSFCLDSADYARVPPDRLDIDGDNDILEPVPFDLISAVRIVDVNSLGGTGHGSTAHPTWVWLDMGAYEHQ